MKPTNLKNLISEQRNRYRDTDLLTIVDQAIDAVENVKSNMATNSILRRSEKMGYLQAFDELLDMLNDIGYYYEMEHDNPVDESAKPDFLDLDSDGDTEEPMKQAARAAKSMVSEAPAINDPKIERMVSEINKLIEAAIDEDGDPIGVIDTSNTWQEPYVYKPIEYKNGALKLTSYSLYNQNKPEIDIIKKSNMEWDGIPTLRSIMKMYKKAIKKKSTVTESALITNGGLQQLREVPLIDRIKKNLIGNN
jgi:hypothetical protein